MRYHTMTEDMAVIADRVNNIQIKSTCRAMALFADERCNLVASGDKTLIAALITSDINSCMRMMVTKELDKVIFICILILFNLIRSFFIFLFMFMFIILFSFPSSLSYTAPSVIVIAAFRL